MGRRTKHNSQASPPGETTWELLLVPISGLDAGRITPELKPKTEIVLSLNLVFFIVFYHVSFCFIFSFFGVLLLWVILFYFTFISTFSVLTSPSLSSHPYSYSLHTPSFSCAKIHCSPYQLLFLIFLNYFHSCLNLPLLSSPNLSLHYTSLLHTHHLLTSLLYQFYTTPTPAIPYTSTQHYINSNTPKHKQGPQNTETHISLHPLTHPSTCPHF
jgi:hypothetical protein